MTGWGLHTSTPSQTRDDPFLCNLRSPPRVPILLAGLALKSSSFISAAGLLCGRDLTFVAAVLFFFFFFFFFFLGMQLPSPFPEVPSILPTVPPTMGMVVVVCIVSAHRQKVGWLVIVSYSASFLSSRLCLSGSATGAFSSPVACGMVEFLKFFFSLPPHAMGKGVSG